MRGAFSSTAETRSTFLEQKCFSCVPLPVMCHATLSPNQEELSSSYTYLSVLLFDEELERVGQWNIIDS